MSNDPESPQETPVDTSNDPEPPQETPANTSNDPDSPQETPVDTSNETNPSPDRSAIESEKNMILKAALLAARNYIQDLHREADTNFQELKDNEKTHTSMIAVRDRELEIIQKSHTVQLENAQKDLNRCKQKCSELEQKEADKSKALHECEQRYFDMSMAGEDKLKKLDEKLNDKYAQAQKQIKKLELTIVGKDSLIAQRDKENLSLKREVEDLSATPKKRASAQDLPLMDKIRKRDERIAELEKELKTAKDEIARRQAFDSKHRAKNAKPYVSNENRMENILKLEAELERADQKLEQTRKDIAKLR